MCFVIARGLRSCTITSCALRMLAAISSGSLDFSILSTSASNSGLLQLAQLNPLGGNVLDKKKVVNRENSVPCARLMFTASTPRDCGPVGGLRIATSIVPQSTTSKEMSKLQ